MFLAACLFGFIYLIGISTFILASHKAPEGFQDEEGFHYGNEEMPASESTALRNEQMQGEPLAAGSSRMIG